jgi:hypothetical protein
VVDLAKVKVKGTLMVTVMAAMAGEMAMTHNFSYTLLVMGMVKAGDTVMGAVWVKVTTLVMGKGVLGGLLVMAMVMVAAVTVTHLQAQLWCCHLGWCLCCCS